MKKLSVVSFCLTMVLVSSAQSATNMTAVVKANNQFGLNLFGNVAKKDLGNVFISPISASLALSMLNNGAKGSTKDGIEKTLGISGLALEDLNSQSQTLISQLQQTGPKFTLNLANSIWVRQGFSILPDFMNRAEASFSAQTEQLDFDSPQASQTINNWVSSKTQGKITEIVPKTLPENLKLVLINATYFNADWTIPFKAVNTRPSSFSLLNKTQESTSMMYQAAPFKYIAATNLEAIELPYGNNEASMIVILPAVDKFNDVEQSMTSESLAVLESALDAQAAQLGTLALPKFKFAYQKDLSQTLGDMGMSEAFSTHADLTGLSQQSLNVSDILQKTFVAVDEKGTEAAAVTAIGVGASAVPQYKFHMNVNRPFIVVVKDNKSQTILFIGHIVDPNAK